MGMFSEITEEAVRKEHNIKLYSRLRNKGLSPQEIVKIIGYEAAKDGFDSMGGWDGHWMNKLSDND